MKSIPRQHVLGLFVSFGSLLTVGSTGWAQRTPIESPPAVGFTWSEPEPGKVSVDSVTPDSPIAEAGLKINDVIVSINGKQPATGAEMDRAIRRIAAGEKAIVRVTRGEKAVDLTYAPPPEVRPADAKAGMFGAMVTSDDRGRIVVADVKPDTPAAKAGLKAGDVIQSVGGKTASSLGDIVAVATRAVAGKRPGEKIDIKFLRGEREQVVVLILGEPLSDASAVQPNVQVVDQVPIVLGIAVNERNNSVLVTQVIPNEPAAKAGIQPNDAILAVGKAPITSYASLARAIKTFKPGDQVSLQVQRGEQTASVVVTVGTRRSSVADVMLDANQDVAEIVTEVKMLKAQVDELTAIVQQLTKEMALLKKK